MDVTIALTLTILAKIQTIVISWMNHTFADEGTNQLKTNAQLTSSTIHTTFPFCLNLIFTVMIISPGRVSPTVSR